MVLLVNTRKEGNRICANYVALGGDEDTPGFVSVDINDLENYIIEPSRIDKEEWASYYGTPVLNALRSMALGEEEIRDKVVATH